MLLFSVNNHQHLQLVSRVEVLRHSFARVLTATAAAAASVSIKSVMMLPLRRREARGLFFFWTFWRAEIEVGEPESSHTAVTLSFIHVWEKIPSQCQALKRKHTFAIGVSSLAARVLPPVGALAFMQAEACTPSCEGHILNDRSGACTVW